MRHWVVISLLILLIGCAKEGGSTANLGVPPPSSQGAPGIQGATGAIGTITTPVEFCPNIPGNFPESGICIDGALYAVYWNGNNPHLSLIPAGQYATTDGRACTFTVVTGCVISY